MRPHALLTDKIPLYLPYSGRVSSVADPLCLSPILLLNATLTKVMLAGHDHTHPCTQTQMLID